MSKSQRASIQVKGTAVGILDADSQDFISLSEEEPERQQLLNLNIHSLPPIFRYTKSLIQTNGPRRKPTPRPFAPERRSI